MSFNSGNSTVGAGKSGAGAAGGFGPDARLFFPGVALGLLVVSPLAAVAFLVSGLIARVRRIRTTRMMLAAAAGTLVGLLIAGFNPLRAVGWHADGTVSLLTGYGLVELAQKGIDLVAEAAALESYTLPTGGDSLMHSLALTFPLAVPTGMWIGAFYTGWMTWRRSALSDIEGAKYDWARPEGVLDRWRVRRQRARMASGAAINARGNTVMVGVGDYGAPVSVRLSTMEQPTMVLGGPRRGKTQLAINTITQAIAAQEQPTHPNPGRSAWILIDFKGDDELPAHAAAFAAAHGRGFKHFTLADKSGAPYHRPHPNAPDSPAFYDPLRRGNATSKTDMLVNSVGRDGDAAAYFRRAYEFTQVVYQVAALTGYDRDKGGFHVLEDLLDLQNLQRVADTTGPDGRGMLADHPKLMARVNAMVDTVKKDDILRGSMSDMATTLSTYGNGPAAGPWLKPGPTPESDINLLDAVLNGEVIVFSLSVQDYEAIATNIGTLALLDLQNVIADLRARLGDHRRAVGDAKAPPPWAPFYVEVEEFGSAGPDAVLDVLNKGGDVTCRPILSTQSWHDIVAVDDTGTFGRRVLDQASNIFVFAITDGSGATVLSETTPEVTKNYPRNKKEFSAGLFGLGLRAANTGAVDTNPSWERQVPPSAFQDLPKYSCIYISRTPDLRVTHTHEAKANAWWERVRTEPVRPDVLPSNDPTQEASGKTPAPPDSNTAPPQPETAPAPAHVPAPTEPAPAARQVPTQDSTPAAAEEPPLPEPDWATEDTPPPAPDTDPKPRPPRPPRTDVLADFDELT